MLSNILKSDKLVGRYTTSPYMPVHASTPEQPLPAWTAPSPLPSFKGEAAGHPFHGNQWGQGAGGDSGGSSRTSEKEALARAVKDANSLSKDMLLEFGPAGTITEVSSKEHKAAFAKQWVNLVGTEVSPKQLVDALLGPKGDAGESGNLTLEGHTIHFVAENGARVYGAPTVSIERTLNMDTKDVHHDLLMIEGGSQGGGVIKNMFAHAIPVYQKMGMKSITTQANLDVGGYAWAKYGFIQDHDHPDSPGKDYFSSRVGSRLKMLDSLYDDGDLRLSNQAVIELSDAIDSVKSYQGNTHEAHLVSDLKTPTLDKETESFLRTKLNKLPEKVTPTVTKWALTGANWHAKLSFDDPVSMARLQDYIGGKT